jgi:hypothetical protein
MNNITWHLHEQCKKNKWYGEDDDWLAEFEKPAVLEFRESKN